MSDNFKKDDGRTVKIIETEQNAPENNFFNPNDIGVANGNFFGLPSSVEESDTVIISVPWDATVSYGTGTSDGPRSIMEASLQVDLFDEKIPEAWNIKAAALPEDEEICERNGKARKSVETIISHLEQGIRDRKDEALVKEVNDSSAWLNAKVKESALKILSQGKMAAVVGGEHSVPYGLIEALGECYEEFGILHLDAHSDTREAYEGFEYSHASIMYNSLKNVPSLSRLVQVGVRDYCSDEHRLMTTSGKIVPFTDFAIKDALFSGKSWKSICGEIIEALPENVYISFDIDALSPENCPNTGTPVPGGLSFAQADYLLYLLSLSGKRIIGFDLCEVAPGAEDEWDANVGSRILFKLLVYSDFNRKK